MHKLHLTSEIEIFARSVYVKLVTKAYGSSKATYMLCCAVYLRFKKGWAIYVRYTTDELACAYGHHSWCKRYSVSQIRIAVYILPMVNIS